MKTSYFTFGQNHTHRFEGHTLDCDVVLAITANDPRQTMWDLFEAKWGHEYDEKPDMTYYPRGIIHITR